VEILPQSLGSEEWVCAAIEEWVALGFLNACPPAWEPHSKGLPLEWGLMWMEFFSFWGLPAGPEEWVCKAGTGLSTEASACCPVDFNLKYV